MRLLDLSQFPDAAVLSERLLFLLNYAVLAPSGHNTQPWLFALEDDAVPLRADRTRALPVVDPHDRELTVSCGAALGHLQVAIRYFAYQPRIDIFPEANELDLFARIALGDSHEPTEQDARLFKAIQMRHTNRQRYEDKQLPAELVLAFEAAATNTDLELLLVVDESVKNNIGMLVGEGDRLQFAAPAFRRELGEWIRSKKAPSRDGMSAKGFGMPALLSPVGASINRGFDLGRGVAAMDKNIAAKTPPLAVLAAAKDEPTNWLRAGQFLSWLLLSLTATGLSAACHRSV